MSPMSKIFFFSFIVVMLTGCSHDGFEPLAKKDADAVNILFLHHSTGADIYRGADVNGQSDVQNWVADYNQRQNTKLNFVEQNFPKSKQYGYFGYGWENYPYDYYNIWVKNEKKRVYKGEPSLDLLTSHWDVIILKHCFPVSTVKYAEEGNIDSPEKTIANYKLQYEALRLKLNEYPNTKFIVWTGAALTQASTTEEQAICAKDFFQWVKESWDKPNDNIHIWDFFELETGGGIYMNDEYAASPNDSHPNTYFAQLVAPLFCQRVIDVIYNQGSNTDLAGNLIEE